MNDDLGDVGLNALEALEAQDQQEQENSAPDGDESKNTEEEVKEPTSDEETNEEETETSDNGETGEKEDEEGESETEEKAGEDEKKELSDEEFEELAKKRGYAKAKTEEETKAEDDRQSQMEKLLARPKEIDEEVWNELPEENKVIYNALPYLVAEGKKGVVQVKTPDQLPDGFEFKDQKAMMKFQNDLQAQENKATQFSNALDARAEREARANTERAEAQKVVSEIESLQKKGELPTPKVVYGKSGFDNDPAVLLINKVLDYRAKRAEGGTNLSVRDSLLLYKAEHPEEFKVKEVKGDIERRNIAKKVAGNSKATSSAVNGDDEDKPHYYRNGMSTEDVLDAVLNDMD
jgi:hypothetical protein